MEARQLLPWSSQDIPFARYSERASDACPANAEAAPQKEPENLRINAPGASGS